MTTQQIQLTCLIIKQQQQQHHTHLINQILFMAFLKRNLFLVLMSKNHILIILFIAFFKKSLSVVNEETFSCNLCTISLCLLFMFLL